MGKGYYSSWQTSFFYNQFFPVLFPERNELDFIFLKPKQANALVGTKGIDCSFTLDDANCPSNL